MAQNSIGAMTMRTIQRRLERVEIVTADKRPVVLYCPWGADPEPLQSRHLQKYPEDAGRLFVVIQTGVPRADDFGMW